MLSDTYRLKKNILFKEEMCFNLNSENWFLKYEVGYWQRVQDVDEETHRVISKVYKEFIVVKKFFIKHSMLKHLRKIQDNIKTNNS